MQALSIRSMQARSNLLSPSYTGFLKAATPTFWKRSAPNASSATICARGLPKRSKNSRASLPQSIKAAHRHSEPWRADGEHQSDSAPDHVGQLDSADHTSDEV